MSVAIAAASVVAFVVAFAWSGIIPAARQAVDMAMAAGRVIGDSSLGDDAKEVAVRRAGVDLLGVFLSIALRSAAAFVLAMLPVAVAAAIGLSPMSETIGVIESWEFILASSVAVTAAFLSWTYAWRS